MSNSEGQLMRTPLESASAAEREVPTAPDVADPPASAPPMEQSRQRVEDPEDIPPGVERPQASTASDQQVPPRQQPPQLQSVPVAILDNTKHDKREEYDLDEDMDYYDNDSLDDGYGQSDFYGSLSRAPPREEHGDDPYGDDDEDFYSDDDEDIYADPDASRRYYDDDCYGEEGDSMDDSDEDGREWDDEDDYYESPSPRVIDTVVRNGNFHHVFVKRTLAGRATFEDLVEDHEQLYKGVRRPVVPESAAFEPWPLATDEVLDEGPHPFEIMMRTIREEYSDEEFASEERDVGSHVTLLAQKRPPGDVPDKGETADEPISIGTPNAAEKLEFGDDAGAMGHSVMDLESAVEKKDEGNLGKEAVAVSEAIPVVLPTSEVAPEMNVEEEILPKEDAADTLEEPSNPLAAGKGKENEKEPSAQEQESGLQGASEELPVPDPDPTSQAECGSFEIVSGAQRAIMQIDGAFEKAEASEPMEDSREANEALELSKMEDFAIPELSRTDTAPPEEQMPGEQERRSEFVAISTEEGKDKIEGSSVKRPLEGAEENREVKRPKLNAEPEGKSDQEKQNSAEKPPILESLSSGAPAAQPAAPPSDAGESEAQGAAPAGKRPDAAKADDTPLGKRPYEGPEQPGKRQKLTETVEDLDNEFAEKFPDVEEVDYSTINKDTVILKYPPNKDKVFLKGVVDITVSDVGRLRPGAYLNDTLIDFYLKFILREMLPPERSSKTQLFNQFFYTKLQEGEYDEAKRKKTMKKWARKIKLFEKDIIIIPVNETSHWSLVIVENPAACFKKLKAKKEAEEKEEKEAEMREGGEGREVGDKESAVSLHPPGAGARQNDAIVLLDDDSPVVPPPEPTPVSIPATTAEGKGRQEQMLQEEKGEGQDALEAPQGSAGKVAPDHSDVHMAEATGVAEEQPQASEPGPGLGFAPNMEDPSADTDEEPPEDPDKGNRVGGGKESPANDESGKGGRKPGAKKPSPTARVKKAKSAEMLKNIFERPSKGTPTALLFNNPKRRTTNRTAKMPKPSPGKGLPPRKRPPSLSQPPGLRKQALHVPTLAKPRMYARKPNQIPPSIPQHHAMRMPGPASHRGLASGAGVPLASSIVMAQLPPPVPSMQRPSHASVPPMQRPTHTPIASMQRPNHASIPSMQRQNHTPIPPMQRSSHTPSPSMRSSQTTPSQAPLLTRPGRAPRLAGQLRSGAHHPLAPDPRMSSTSRSPLHPQPRYSASPVHAANPPQHQPLPHHLRTHSQVSHPPKWAKTTRSSMLRLPLSQGARLQPPMASQLPPEVVVPAGAARPSVVAPARRSPPEPAEPIHARHAPATQAVSAHPPAPNGFASLTRIALAEQWQLPPQVSPPRPPADAAPAARRSPRRPDRPNSPKRTPQPPSQQRPAPPKQPSPNPSPVSAKPPAAFITTPSPRQPEEQVQVTPTPARDKAAKVKTTPQRPSSQSPAASGSPQSDMATVSPGSRLTPIHSSVGLDNSLSVSGTLAGLSSEGLSGGRVSPPALVTIPSLPQLTSTLEELQVPPPEPEAAEAPSPPSVPEPPSEKAPATNGEEFDDYDDYRGYDQPEEEVDVKSFTEEEMNKYLEMDFPWPDTRRDVKHVLETFSMEHSFRSGELPDLDQNRYNRVKEHLTDKVIEKQREERELQNYMWDSLDPYVVMETACAEAKHLSGYFILCGFLDEVFPVYKHILESAYFIYHRTRYKLFSGGLSGQCLAVADTTEWNLLEISPEMWQAGGPAETEEESGIEIKLGLADFNDLMMECQKNEAFNLAVGSETKILHFDSMRACHNSSKIFRLIRQYLADEWERKMGDCFTLDAVTAPGVSVSAPQQENSYDCGVFLLHNCQMYFEKPLENLGKALDRRDWYEIGDKRKEIERIILRKREELGDPRIDIERVLQANNVTVERQRGLLSSFFTKTVRKPQVPIKSTKETDRNDPLWQSFSKTQTDFLRRLAQNGNLVDLVQEKFGGSKYK